MSIPLVHCLCNHRLMKMCSRLFKMEILCFSLVILLVMADGNLQGVTKVECNTSVGRSTNISLSKLNDKLSENVIPVLTTKTGQNGLTEPNDPFYSKQWAFSKINITNLWNITSGSEVIIAILDTGIDHNNEDLKDKVVSEVNFTDSPSTNDFNGHGTHIAGIISATPNNGLGIAGLMPTGKLMNVKVANDYGFCVASTVARGIIWAVNNGAKVVNISIEIWGPSIDLEQAVNYAWDHGVIIVAAAGNQGNGLPIYPAYYKNCIAVAAIRPDNTLAPLSNYGDWVDVVAPGFNIYSTLPGNKYSYETGTSFASAYVSGLAAIFLTIVDDVNGNGMLNDEVRSAIEAQLGKQITDVDHQ